jgi:hypothetical protein
VWPKPTAILLAHHRLLAAERLKVRDRHVRRMLLHLRERGDRSPVRGLRSRPSSRKLAARFEQKIVAPAAALCEFPITLRVRRLSYDFFHQPDQTPFIDASIFASNWLF